jgi:hypothetical protein
MAKLERRSTELSPVEWQALQDLAADLQALARFGATAGQPSWRTLLKQIARGEITLARPPAPPVYTLAEAAAYLKMSPGGLRYYLRGNELTPDRRDGRAYLFHKQTLDHFQTHIRRKK